MIYRNGKFNDSLQNLLHLWTDKKLSIIDFHWVWAGMELGLDIDSIPTYFKSQIFCNISWHAICSYPTNSLQYLICCFAGYWSWETDYEGLCHGCGRGRQSENNLRSQGRQISHRLRLFQVRFAETNNEYSWIEIDKLLLRWDEKTGEVWLQKKLDKPLSSVIILKVTLRNY